MQGGGVESSILNKTEVKSVQLSLLLKSPIVGIQKSGIEYYQKLSDVSKLTKSLWWLGGGGGVLEYQFSVQLKPKLNNLHPL